jgi:hypothetical protein
MRPTSLLLPCATSSRTTTTEVPIERDLPAALSATPDRQPAPRWRQKRPPRSSHASATAPSMTAPGARSELEHLETGRALGDERIVGHRGFKGRTIVRSRQDDSAPPWHLTARRDEEPASVMPLQPGHVLAHERVDLFQWSLVRQRDDEHGPTPRTKYAVPVPSDSSRNRGGLPGSALKLPQVNEPSQPEQP